MAGARRSASGLSNASARSGTTAAASIATSRVHVSTASTGRNAPTTTSAPRTPIASDRNGTPTEPRARATSRSPSTAPKTRASTSGRGRALQERVTRDRHRRASRADHGQQDERERELRPDADEDERQAPERDPDPERTRQPASRREPGDDEGGRDAADASRRVEKPEPGCAHVQELEGEQDDQDVERTVDDSLGEDERDDQTQARLREERAEAGDGIPESAALVVLRFGLDPLAMANARDDERRAGVQETAATTKTTSTPAEVDEQAAEARSEERADVVDGARAGVRRGELGGRARELRQQRGLRRPERRGRERREDGETVDGERRRIRDDGEGHARRASAPGRGRTRS